MSASADGIRSNLAKVDAYENTAADYDELPEVTDADFARAVQNKGGLPVRGRPPLGNRAKRQVSLRLDPAVIEHFRAGGAGWQVRVNGWLAARQAVNALIDTLETSASEVQRLLVDLKDSSGGVRVLQPDQLDRVQTVERHVALMEDAASGLRRVLVEQGLTARAD